MPQPDGHNRVRHCDVARTGRSMHTERGHRAVPPQAPSHCPTPRLRGLPRVLTSDLTSRSTNVPAHTLPETDTVTGITFSAVSAPLTRAAASSSANIVDCWTLHSTVRSSPHLRQVRFGSGKETAHPNGSSSWFRCYRRPALEGPAPVVRLFEAASRRSIPRRDLERSARVSDMLDWLSIRRRSESLPVVLNLRERTLNREAVRDSPYNSVGTHEAAGQRDRDVSRSLAIGTGVCRRRVQGVVRWPRSVH